MIKKPTCKECQELGASYTVDCVGSVKTLIASKPYWDEDGNYHNEDPNIKIDEYK